MADDKKGMLRHVDILGRVVIPKEVRRALRINYGDLMEFSTLSDKQVVMRKFHLLREIASLVNSIVRISRLNSHSNIIITDTEKVLSINGEESKTDDLDMDIVHILNKREVITRQGLILSKHQVLSNESLINPIILNGDVLGGVIINDTQLNDYDRAVAQEIVAFLLNYFSE